MKIIGIIGMAIAATLFAFALAIVSTPSEAQSPYNSGRAPTSYELLAAAITATGATGATNLATLSSACSIVSFENTTGVEIDALIGSAKKRVPAGQFREYDLGAANTRWAAGTVIKVYGNGTAPTGGAFELFCQSY